MTTTTPTSERKISVPRNYDLVAWKWMRYSGILLIPLAWMHVLIQDVLVGVHQIDLDYVAMRWANLGWKVYTASILAFAFAHGMNGLRQVLLDYIHSERARRFVSWLLLITWFVITAIGAIGIIGGVRQP